MTNIAGVLSNDAFVKMHPTVSKQFLFHVFVERFRQIVSTKLACLDFVQKNALTLSAREVERVIDD